MVEHSCIEIPCDRKSSSRLRFPELPIRKMKKMQSYSGTPFSFVHMPFDRACDGDPEYHHQIFLEPSFPYKNLKIPPEVRRPEKMGASRKSLTPPPGNIRERRGFDLRIQNKNLHQTRRI
jgi:hypothetical protein